MDPEQLKGLGNECLRNKEYDQAIKHYTEAIEVAQKQNKPTHVYFSNRCAAYQSIEKYDQALQDANDCIAAKNDWPKGYLRKGKTLIFMGKLQEAETSYMDGLKINSTDSGLQSAFAELRTKIETEVAGSGPAGSMPMGTPFGRPDEILKKLQNNPKTAAFLKDPTYMAMIMDLVKNPQNMMKYMQDERIMTTLSVLTGIDMNEMDDNVKSSAAKQAGEMAAKRNSAAAAAKDSDAMDTSESKPKPAEPAAKKADDEMEVEEEVDQNVKLAMAEKELGTKAYKNKNFEEAHMHYAKAFELDPSQPVYKMNTAATFLEEKKYEECRKSCFEAMDVARENKGLPNKISLIAKTLARIGTSYEKENNLEEALNWYNKSVSELREKSILAKIKKLETAKKEAARRAYFSEEKFAEAKAKGNEGFKSGKYPDAIQNYHECIKRKDDKDKNNFEDLAIIYANRAACYHKLMEFNLAAADCKKAIQLNPKYLKAYLRQGNAFEALKKITDAKNSFQEALNIQPDSVEAQQGFQRCVQKAYATRNDEASIKERVKNDPEVMQIMQDPGMRIILDQMQNDPAAIKTHLENPEIAGKIQKLIDVGIIQVR